MQKCRYFHLFVLFCSRSLLTQCSSLELFSLQIYFSFTDCTMEYIICNWLRNIRPHLFEVVWTDFGKELPCEYISCCLEWADSLKVKVISQLKGWMGLDSNKSHRSKRPYGLDFAKFRQCHAICQVECCNTCCDGRREVNVARITIATRGAIWLIFERARYRGPPN